ncbi:MAG: hypothetical protein NVS3B17_02280 [Vulcanimicrobiaceae bacterium]
MPQVRPSVVVGTSGLRRPGLTRWSDEDFPITERPSEADAPYSDSCEPLTQIPSWWAGFLFHVLNPRQLSLYLYLSLLSADGGSCHPTTKQIREDLGISSLTIVFEAMSALEQGGFISRSRRNLTELKSRRNVYQRPSCEFTILRLLESGRIDALLRATPGDVNQMSTPARELRDEWLDGVLGPERVRFDEGNAETKTAILLAALQRVVRAHCDDRVEA